jgi:hypothetical protein
MMSGEAAAKPIRKLALQQLDARVRRWAGAENQLFSALVRPVPGLHFETACS